MSLQVSSPAFTDGTRIPDQYTCVGANVSPPLKWSGSPEGTRSFVLVCDDPDAPGGTWHHWTVFDVPPDVTRLETDFSTTETAERVRQAVNDFKRVGYGGPCPPRGHGTHHYRFRLLALDISSLPVGRRPKCAKAERAARRHVVAEAVLIGTFSL